MNYLFLQNTTSFIEYLLLPIIYLSIALPVFSAKTLNVLEIHNLTDEKIEIKYPFYIFLVYNDFSIIILLI